MQHVFGRLEQQLVLDGIDAATLFEPGELLLTLLNLLVQPRDTGHHVRVGFLGQPLDRL